MTDTEAKKFLDALNNDELPAMPHYCAKCGILRENVDKREITEIRMIKNERIEVKGIAAFCPICGARISDECDKKLELKAFELYRRRMGLLQPHEVRCIREKYRLSARQFAALLNLGDHVIYDIENGVLSTKTIDTAIRNVGTFAMLKNYLLHNSTKLPNKVVENLLLLCYNQVEIFNETIFKQSIKINAFLPCYA